MTRTIVAALIIIAAAADVPRPSGAIVTCGIAGAENCIRSGAPPPVEPRTRPTIRDRSRQNR
jgi:hypothetical protein